jgi:hypothetical protein
VSLYLRERSLSGPSRPTWRPFVRFAASELRITMSDFPENDCPFCRMTAERILASNDHAFAVADAFPLSPGHMLIIRGGMWRISSN